ncbi:MAG: TRAP transporter large permease subunit, partial [Proteobacteria bacterium]|nr:TRAP transporter large permease subunit [Pseudomonadota bacterium]
NWVGLLQVTLFVFIILLGFPMAFTLLAMSVIFGYYAFFDPKLFAESGIFANRIFDLIVKNAFSTMENHVLIAIPLFLFMGYVVEKAGIVARLFNAIRVATYKLPGNLAVASLITCAIFSTATGIVGAVVTLMGLLAWPAMVNNGYNKTFASGVVTAGGCLGILIPPSIMFIVYAVVAALSPLRLFAAAMLPGLMLAGLYIIYVIIAATLNPKLAPKPKMSDWNMFKDSIYLTARTSTMIIWLFVGSSSFASVFAYLGGQDIFDAFFKSLNLEAWQFLVVTQILIFVLGWPLEWTEIIIIFVPIFLPLVKYYGIDPYFFGILIGLNLQTSFLSPPMAMAAFYLKGVQGDRVSLKEIFKGGYPFIYMVILSMVILYLFQPLSTWLPNYLFGQGG